MSQPLQGIRVVELAGLAPGSPNFQLMACYY
jgi:crotonobetainyl-CoA:carnitine CoA-transferase CaiB-like acyl-CoA transferase